MLIERGTDCRHRERERERERGTQYTTRGGTWTQTHETGYIPGVRELDRWSAGILWQ